ncbi:MAG: hypothetical protein ACE5I1_16995 [bacterium]
MNTYDPKQSHDQNFKTILVENPWDTITFAMPQCADYFEHAPEIIPIREETLKTFLSDSFLETDVPFLVKYERTGFIFLIEHKHDKYSFSIYHLARYVTYLQEQYKCDVIPIVFFANASAKSKSLEREITSEFMGKRYHYFTYEAVLMKDFKAKDYLDSPNIIARLMLPFMQYSKGKLLEVLDNAVTGVLKLVDATQGLRQRKYLEFVMQYFKLGKKEWEAYRFYKQEQKQVNEMELITEILRKEGWEKGQEEGREEGQINEGQNTLLILLPKRLGPVPPEIEKSIRALTDLDRIHGILARLLEIKDWQELEQLLNGHKN